MLPLSYPVRQWYITIWNSCGQNTRGGSKNLTRKSFHVGILQISKEKSACAPFRWRGTGVEVNMEHF